MGVHDMDNEFALIIANLAGTVAGLGFFALLIERLVEKFIKPIQAAQPYAAYIALVLGVVLAAGFQLDIFTAVAASIGGDALTPWVGIILTGLAIGGGSNFLHDIWPSK